MKTLIIQALSTAFDILQSNIPQTKTVMCSKSIKDVNPFELMKFIEDNKIPNTAFFDYEILEHTYNTEVNILLSWEEQKATSSEYKTKYCNRVFSSIAFKEVYNLLTLNGYKRVGFNSKLLKQFDDTNIYQMYISQEFDRLKEYYSLSFKK